MRTLNKTELAELLRLSPHSIHSTLVRRPDRLPPPIRVPGSKRLVWLAPDVMSWLKLHQAKVALASRKRGRPHKQPTSISQ
jgi:predicted DNA-binding transcriptional regulator AlpA